MDLNSIQLEFMCNVFICSHLLVFSIISVHSNAEIDVEKYFSHLLSEDKGLSAGIAAIKTLLMVLEKTKCKSFDDI